MNSFNTESPKFKVNKTLRDITIENSYGENLIINLTDLSMTKSSVAPKRHPGLSETTTIQGYSLYKLHIYMSSKTINMHFQ